MSPELLTLLRYCLVLTLLIHLPFIGMLVGGSALSLLMNLLGRNGGDRDYRRFSQELIETLSTRKSALFLFGLLPIFPVALIYDRLLYDTGILRWYFWLFLFITIFAGLLFLIFYRASFRFKSDLPTLSLGTGVIGLLTLVFAYKLFFIGTGIVFNPEKLPFLQKNLYFVLSWNSVVKIILFFLLFFGITGGAVLFFVGQRPREGETFDPEYGKLASQTGTILTTFATLPIPVFVLFNLITLPDIALSGGVFAISVAIMILALAVCVVLSVTFGNQAGRSNAYVFVLYILIFLAVLMNDNVAIGNAYQERSMALEIQAEEIKAEKEALREKPIVSKPSASLKMGEGVYDKRCSTCHAFESRDIGPPLYEVLPKYRDNVEGLKGFIRKPTLVNPDYPPMLAQGLTEEEIESVALYILDRAASSVEMGKGVFEERCGGCHQFVSSLVGPPLYEVLPKYRNNFDGLKGFIRNPVKVNPDYPPMPELGLNKEEVDSVASYLLDTLERK
jgi:cytochrome c2